MSGWTVINLKGYPLTHFSNTAFLTQWGCWVPLLRQKSWRTTISSQGLLVFGRGVLGYRDNVLPQGDISSILEDRMGFPSGSDGKASACNAGDLGSIPGLGRSPGEGNDNPLQYSYWKIPWTDKPGRLQSMGSQRVGHNWATSLSFHFSAFNTIVVVVFLNL